MDIVIRDIKAKNIPLFKSLAEQLGLKTKKLSRPDQEDAALAIAIFISRELDYTAEASIRKTLKKTRGMK